jgi:hypothetical protein
MKVDTKEALARAYAENLSTLESHPWRLDRMGGVRRDSKSAAERLDAPAPIALGKAPCRVCSRPHWRPDGDARCVGCELAAYGGAAQ